MQAITINVKDPKLADKVAWLLEHFRDDGLEIVSREDLTALKATRGEERISFEDYLAHGN